MLTVVNRIHSSVREVGNKVCKGKKGFVVTVVCAVKYIVLCIRLETSYGQAILFVLAVLPMSISQSRDERYLLKISYEV